MYAWMHACTERPHAHMRMHTHILKCICAHEVMNMGDAHQQTASFFH